MNILVINPGATSTKIGFFEGNKEIFIENIEHEVEVLQQFIKVPDQLDYRLNKTLEVLKAHNVNLSKLDGIAARGGVLPPVESGAYEINGEMIDFLKNKPRVEHASNLGAIIAQKLLSKCDNQTKAFVYDPVTVDQYTEISRVSGLKGVERVSIGHALNMRSVAIKIAEEIKKKYEECRFIVAHLGGGNTISVHYKGRMIDSLSDDEGPFSTERTGELAVKSVMDLCYQYSKKEMDHKRREVGGMYSYLGTNDARVVEERISQGDKEAELIFNALAYQIGKGIGSLATVLEGNIDGIILTGGLAHSNLLIKKVKKRIAFLGDIYVVPGEREMFALASGVNRVLIGSEKAHHFSEETGD